MGKKVLSPSFIVAEDLQTDSNFERKKKKNGFPFGISRFYVKLVTYLVVMTVGAASVVASVTALGISAVSAVSISAVSALMIVAACVLYFVRTAVSTYSASSASSANATVATDCALISICFACC